MLIAYSMVSSHVQTTRDYLEAPKLYSGCEVDYLHVALGAQLATDVLAPYDIVFHSYCARLIFDNYVSPDYIAAMRAFRGLKVLAVQDEYDTTDKLKAAIRDLGFHVVLTCVPQSELEKVYPRAEFPGVLFHTVFTGYVPDEFAAQSPAIVPLRERTIRLGYRGRDIGPIYGRLGRDKYEIGARMLQICAAEGQSCDIAMDEKSRIYGTAWFDFIGNCRAMLGTESGSNVFDFDGAIRRKFHEMSEKLGRPPTYAEFDRFTAAMDSSIDMGQISPRVFECALMRTPMVLLRGRYSDALVADEHYIALEKDYSNAKDVLRRLDDFDALEAMTQRTYDHLVASGRYGYRHIWTGWMALFDERKKLLAADADSRPVMEQGPAAEARDPAHPMFEAPTRHVKGMDDYNRQVAAANKVEMSPVVRLGWGALLRFVPRRPKMGIATALKRALEAQEKGERQAPSGRLLLLVWSVTPGPVRRRVQGRLGQIEFVQKRT